MLYMLTKSLSFNNSLSSLWVDQQPACMQYKQYWCCLFQTGEKKATVEDSESSDYMEDLLEKINRTCRDYMSDKDPDYEVW
jgi:hypothetical protein